MTIYSSREAQYKTPFGAVKTGELVRFTLRVPHSYGCTEPRFFIFKDGEAPQQYLLQKTASEADADIFTLSYAVAEAGLYFYWFDLWVHYRKLYRGEGGRAQETTGEGECYQLTVYDAAFTSPAAAKGGVMYQIFPDRFYESRPRTAMHFNERIYRADKTKEPYYWPDDQEDGYLTWDFFGGDFAGIEKKLPYLAALGVNWLYLNPIFEAHSNHRYNTADYMNADPDLGTNEDFIRLCKAAKKKGIRIILDGVFSHTGSDSIYFNKEARYPSFGAWQGETSPYRPWYTFRPDGSYSCWWGFDTLPNCNENDPSFRQFICGEGGVIETWLQRGAGGFRLDVADELPDSFIADIRRTMKKHSPDSLLIGEVWEDATTKTAYNLRRQYFWGQELDGVMNYPFRTAILDFARTLDAASFAESVLQICENYPAPALHASTVHLSTHDTVRAITAIAGEEVAGHDRHWQSGRRLAGAQYDYAIPRLKLAFVLQFALPGIPCIYYGDEIAMQGYKDPFNRAYFDWHSSETRLKNLVAELSALRKKCPAFREGQLVVRRAEGGILVLERHAEGSIAAVGINASQKPAAFTLLGKQVELLPMRWAWHVQ